LIEHLDVVLRRAIDGASETEEMSRRSSYNSLQAAKMDCSYGSESQEKSQDL
jgi:hypothetical protein